MSVTMTTIYAVVFNGLSGFIKFLIWSIYIEGIDVNDTTFQYMMIFKLIIWNFH